MNSELSIKFLWQLKVSTKFNSLNIAFDFFSSTYFVIFWRVVCLWYLKMCIINVMVNNWIDCSHFCMFSFLVLLEFNLFMNKQTDCHPHVSPLMHWCLALGIEKVMVYIILMVLFFRKKDPMSLLKGTEMVKYSGYLMIRDGKGDFGCEQHHVTFMYSNFYFLRLLISSSLDFKINYQQMRRKNYRELTNMLISKSRLRKTSSTGPLDPLWNHQTSILQCQGEHCTFRN